MSWDGYVTNMMGIDQSGKVSVQIGAICGMNPPGVWASTPNFTVTPEQIKVLCGNPSSFAQSGPHIGPYKCRFLRDNKDTDGMWCIDFKTTADAAGHCYNVCVGYSHTAIIIAIGTSDASGGQVASQVFKNVQHLRHNKM